MALKAHLFRVEGRGVLLNEKELRWLFALPSWDLISKKLSSPTRINTTAET